MKVFGYNAMKFAICNTPPYLENVISFQLSVMRLLALLRCAMQSPVELVFTVGSPSKIRDVVVYPGSVKMTALVPHRSQTDKGFEHQDVDHCCPRTDSTTKLNLLVAIQSCPGINTSSLIPWQVPKCPLTTAANGENSPILGDAVSRETRYLAKATGDGRIGVRHCSYPVNSSGVEKPVCGIQDRAGFVFA